MSFDLTIFDDSALSDEFLTYLLDQEALDAHIHFSRLWDYYRNSLLPGAGVAADALNLHSRPYFQAQEVGLPARITGVMRLGAGGEELAGVQRKEVVIENDIAWRVHTMVDSLFGQSISIASLADDPAKAKVIEAVLGALFAANGGDLFFQEMATLGSIYGSVDVVLRLPQPFSISQADAARAAELAGRISLELVEASRVMPILEEDDFRRIRYWVQSYRKQAAGLDSGDLVTSAGWAGPRDLQPRTVEVVEILSAGHFQRYEDRQLVAEGTTPLNLLPVVHVQNLPLPGSYEGLSDVEPLVPLQDELNTRLSDRASRVTFQSFKMYLAKGIEDFIERPIGPGQMWATHNPDACIQEFGTDPGSPSEELHIQQVRQAMDKVSGVTPLAAGLISGNIGNLTSATALRVLLSGLLSRTQRKRLTYGQGIREIISKTLALLDAWGVLPTSSQDRRVEIHWPSPLPEDQTQQLANAQAKAALGVPIQRILAELGYDNDGAARR